MQFKVLRKRESFSVSSRHHLLESENFRFPFSKKNSVTRVNEWTSRVVIISSNQKDSHLSQDTTTVNVYTESTEPGIFLLLLRN